MSVMSRKEYVAAVEMAGRMALAPSCDTPSGADRMMQQLVMCVAEYRVHFNQILPILQRALEESDDAQERDMLYVTLSELMRGMQ